MAIETSFTIKQLNADEALKQAEEKAKKTAQNIDNTINKNPVDVQVKPFGKTVAGELKKIKAGLSAVGAEGAGEMGKLAKVFSAGPIAFAVAAIGGGLAYLANGIKDTYDKMTLSSEEYAYRQAQITKESHDATEKMRKEQESAAGYFDRLSEINDMENVSNSAKKEAIGLIALLTEKYGDLGLSIDAVTGQINGFDEAQKEALVRNREEKIKALAEERDSISKSVFSQAGITGRSLHKNAWSGWVDDSLHFFGRERQSETDIKGIFSGVLNSGRPIGDQIKFFEAIRDKTNTQGDMDSVQKVIDLLKQKLDLENRINKVTRNGTETNEEYAKRLREKTNKDKTEKARTEAAGEYQKQRQLGDANDSMKDAAAYDKLKTTSEQIEFKQKKVSEELEKQKNLQTAIDEISKRKHTGDDAEAKRAQDVAAIARLETEVAQSKNDQLKIEIDIDKLKQKAADYYREAKDNLDAELAVQKKINEGKFEEAERQKIINDLKAKGLTVNEKEINAMMKKKKELAALKFDDSMKRSGYDLLYQQQKKSNYRQAEYDKRVRDKERELGGPLNDAQKSKIYDMLDMEIKMNMEPKLDFRNTDIKTNDLTARGGFSTGAVVVPKDRINEQIRGYAARQVSLLSQIKALLGQEGVI